jgi:hypothetical protein
MRKNNYNVNSEGPSIELSCSYDCDLSRIYFEENFKIIQHNGYRTHTKAYYIDCGNVPDDDSIIFSVKGEKSAKVKYIADQGCFEPSEIETWDDDTIESEIIGYLSERPSVVNYQNMNENDLDKTGLELSPSKNLIWISVRGYSQGDYAEIAYCPDDLKKAWGNVPKENDLRKEFTRLFYDAPIWACFEINGEEYRYDEYMDDSYEWDREKFASIVSEKSGIDRDVLLDFLPDYPDYN